MTTATLSRSDIETAVAAAVAAPSVLNTQPWRFTARGDTIDVHADLARGLPVSDPRERALMISCGAALFNLRLAIAALGREPVIQLLPAPQTPTLLARVRCAGKREPTADEATLHAAIPRRRTSRLPLSEQPVPDEILARLEEAAAAEGGVFRKLTGWETPGVIKAVHDADRVQRADPAVRAEIERWIHRPPGSPDGIPDAALGPRPSDPAALVRDFALGAPVVGRETADFERAPFLGTLYTPADDRAAWLRAGQALERLLLIATDRGLAASLLTQAVEVQSLRWLLRAPAMGPAVPQALLRLGYIRPGTPAPSPTPRRPIADVLRFD